MSRDPQRLTAASLSVLLPGLGQLYRGERAKAFGVLCAAAGILVGLVLALWGPPAIRSGMTVLMLAFTYPFLLVPAVIDAWRGPDSQGRSVLGGESVGYVVFLLFMIGPLALPILWQSPALPRWAKILLTSAVVFVALAAVALLLFIGPILERLVPELLEIIRQA